MESEKTTTHSITDMPDKPTRKVSDKSTKQEMLEAYQALAKQVEEKRAAELAPERRLEERRTEEAVKAAAAVAPEGIDREIGHLKAEIGKMLADVSDRLASEASRFRSIQKAVESKEGELKELYGIEKAAVSLAALIEAQNQKRSEFEQAMSTERDRLQTEIDALRAEWDKEKKAHDAELKERDGSEKKARDREREDFLYNFKRDQQTMKDKLADEKAALEKDIAVKREAFQQEFAEREKNVAEKEKELADLRARAATFPKEMEAAVAQAVKEASDRLKIEAKNREDLLRKEFEGERNVLTARNETLEKVNKDVFSANAKLAQQLEAAYQKVQDIAEKTVEGTSQAKTLADLQKLLVEQSRKGGAEKG